MLPGQQHERDLVAPRATQSALELGSLQCTSFSPVMSLTWSISALLASISLGNYQDEMSVALAGN